MKRIGKILGAVVLTVVGSGSALAGSSPTIKSASDSVQVGKEGAWKPAKAGMAIADTDFVKIPADAAATITLPDNTTRDFKGKAVIPGRRLGDKAGAGMSVWFSQSVQKMAGTGTTMTKANGMGKADDMTASHKDPIWDSMEGVTHKLTLAEIAEVDFSGGRYEKAATEAAKVIADAEAAPVQKRRAHLVLGECSASSASYTAALKELDIASEPVASTEGPDGPLLRLAALLQRGQVQTQLGNDAAAQEDFKIVAASAEKAPAAQAKFLLGVIAFGSKDQKTARNWFDQLKDASADRPLYEAGMAMLEPAK